MKKNTDKNDFPKEILACNEEVSKELFTKELYVIVSDGLEASLEEGPETSQE